MKSINTHTYIHTWPSTWGKKTQGTRKTGNLMRLRLRNKFSEPEFVYRLNYFIFLLVVSSHFVSPHSIKPRSESISLTLALYNSLACRFIMMRIDNYFMFLFISLKYELMNKITEILINSRKYCKVMKVSVRTKRQHCFFSILMWLVKYAHRTRRIDMSWMNWPHNPVSVFCT